MQRRRGSNDMEWSTLYRGGTGEIEEKKSRFIATIEPVKTEEEAAGFIAKMKKKYWDARHNCSAFIIGSGGEKSRCSDDGEPSGTAGRPMLDVLSKEMVTNVCVVVTRYFGGTLLGTGGLVRAYSAAVKEGLKACELIKKQNGFLTTVTAEYNDHDKIQRMAQSKGYHVISTDYGENVTLRMISDKDDIVNDICDATSARAKCSKPEPVIFYEADGTVKLEE